MRAAEVDTDRGRIARGRSLAAIRWAAEEIVRIRAGTFLVLFSVSIAACNRAGMRIPGAAGSFHAARTGYLAIDTTPRSVRVSLPVDMRSSHFGEPIAGTRWRACRTDPFWEDSAPRTLAAELERELRESRIFETVHSPEDQDLTPLVLETEIRAWCSQAVGFFFIRVAGITSLRFTLKDGNETIFERSIERVVTDADPQYTGSQVSFVEQAMKILISDSLREVLRELLPALDKLRPAAQQGAAAAGAIRWAARAESPTIRPWPKSLTRRCS